MAVPVTWKQIQAFRAKCKHPVRHHRVAWGTGWRECGCCGASLTITSAEADHLCVVCGHTEALHALPFRETAHVFRSADQLSGDRNV